MLSYRVGLLGLIWGGCNHQTPPRSALTNTYEPHSLSTERLANMITIHQIGALSILPRDCFILFVSLTHNSYC